MLIAAWGEFVVKNKIIVAGLFLALGSQVVIAKDKNLGQSYDWRGWYLGAQFGDLWSQTDLTDKGVISELNANTTGLVGGIEYGYNFQSGNWVYGTESDFGLSNAIGHGGPVVPNTYNMNWDSHTRLRLGYAPDQGPLLVYVVGGLAIADFTFTDGETGDKTSTTYFGGSAGIGAEYGFTPKISGQVEFDYDDFSAFGGLMVVNDYDAHLKNASTIRAALNFHF